MPRIDRPQVLVPQARPGQPLPPALGDHLRKPADANALVGPNPRLRDAFVNGPNANAHANVVGGQNNVGNIANAGAAIVDGPYKDLAARGNYEGFIPTKSGDIFVGIRLGKNPGVQQPLVYLGGLAQRYIRSGPMAEMVNKAFDHTIITVILPGQGETLLRDVATQNGRSVHNDITADAQAKAVLDALDALGIKDKVSVAGLSYGGAIAAAVKQADPKRIDKVLLVAPYVETQAKGDPKIDMYRTMMRNPFNPWGQAMYRSAMRSSLANTFGVPEMFNKCPDKFHDALYRLSYGLEDYNLRGVVKNMQGVHMLVVPEDGASPPDWNKQAFAGVKNGSFMMAADEDKGHHDLVGHNPAFVAAWMDHALRGKLPEVRR